MSKKSQLRYKTIYPKKPVTQSSGWGRKILVYFIILFSLILGWLKISNPETLPILHVKIIDNSNQIEHKLLHDTIVPYVSKGMLWVKLSSLKNALEDIPWVEQVLISRKFPHTIIVQIIERKPIARWNNQLLLDSHGNIFNPTLGVIYHELNALPSLFGPEDQQNSAWIDFQESSNALSPLNISVKTLKLNENGTCDLTLNNDIHLIVNDKSLNESLIQFAAVYPRICQSHEKDIETIDLRYNNGFAIQWKINKAKNKA